MQRDPDPPFVNHADAFGPRLQAELLAHLARTGDLLKACGLVRTTTRAVRQRAKDDPVFAEALANAWADFRDGVLIPEAHRRAVEGTRKGVYYRGELGRDENGEPAYERQFSDALLIRLLEKHDPTFRPHQVVENTTNGPGPADLATLSPEARAKMEALLEQLAKDDPKHGQLPPTPPSPQAPPDLDEPVDGS